MEGQMHVDKYGKIRRLTKNLLKIQHDDYDAVLVVSGREGVGKSTLGIEVGQHMQKEHGFKFDFERNLAYNAGEAIEKIKELEQFETLVLDEGMRLAWRRQWFASEQRRLARLFSQIRSRNLCLIICIPDFMHLDTYYREHRTLYWLHVIDRSYAILFAPDTTAGAKDRWGIEIAQKMIRTGKRKPVTTFDDVEQKLRKHKTIPSFVDWFRFPPLKDYEKYREISNRRKLQEDEEEEAEGPKDTRHMAMIKKALPKLKKDLGMSTKEIATIYGVTPRSVNTWMQDLRIDGDD